MDNDSVKELNMDELAAASGGSSLRDHPKYNEIKEFYKEKGSRQTLLLCSYYKLSSKECQEMVKIIESDIAHGGVQRHSSDKYL